MLPTKCNNDLRGHDQNEAHDRSKFIEKEAEKLRRIQESIVVDNETRDITDAGIVVENQKDVDARSVYVGNVDYSAAAEELQELFREKVSSVNRVTIPLNRYSGHPKGYAYVEFAQPMDVARAIEFHGTKFKGRILTVIPKRTNNSGCYNNRHSFRLQKGFHRSSAIRGRGITRGTRGYRGRGRSNNRGHLISHNRFEPYLSRQ
ncbi:LAFE_0A05952g1_1 [Lachancea fermentati]|uniref:LAFE_0A05952g1_1 n=1 Tax=Lachancea fermentati TaxID=4955 RepID=A0A1G4M713_LACFM|nr:LAFE_0A05952g1_1 [Lachancea fermentati]